MKKLLHILSVVMLVACCALIAGAQGESSLTEQRPYKENEKIKIIDNVVYQLCEDKALGGKFYEVYDWFATPEAADNTAEINIVPEIGGIKVKAVKQDGDSYSDYYIPDYGTEHNYSVKRVTLPDTVEYIGNGLFSILDGVEELVIPASVRATGNLLYLYSDGGYGAGVPEYPVWTFEGMESLKRVTFSGSIEILGGFKNCKKLEKVTLKGDAEYIGCDAFYGCTSLKSFKIPSTVMEIGGYAFYGSGITSITIPASVKRLGDEDYASVFKNCKKLTKVVFSDRKASQLLIDLDTFRNCTALKKVYLPKSVKRIYIEPMAFRNCRKLTKIYNTDNIVRIGEQAFRTCTSLTSFTVSAKVTKIGKNAFYGCTKLKKVTVNSKKAAPSIGKKAFGRTAEGIKFVAKNSTAAKSWKSGLKKSGLKKMKVCYVKYVNV